MIKLLLYWTVRGWFSLIFVQFIFSSWNHTFHRSALVCLLSVCFSVNLSLSASQSSYITQGNGIECVSFKRCKVWPIWLVGQAGWTPDLPVGVLWVDWLDEDRKEALMTHTHGRTYTLIRKAMLLEDAPFLLPSDFPSSFFSVGSGNSSPSSRPHS